MNRNFYENNVYNPDWFSFVQEKKQKKSESIEKNTFKSKEKYIETIPENRGFDSDYSQNFPENSSKNFSKPFDSYTKKNVMEVCEESRYEKNSNSSSHNSKEPEYNDWLSGFELISDENFYEVEESKKPQDCDCTNNSHLCKACDLSGILAKNLGYFYNEGSLQTVDSELTISFTTWDNKGTFTFNNNSITFTKTGRYLVNYGLICKDCVNGYTEIRINDCPVSGTAVQQLSEMGVTNISTVLTVAKGDVLTLIIGGTYVVLADKGTSVFMIIDEIL